MSRGRFATRAPAATGVLVAIVGVALLSACSSLCRLEAPVAQGIGEVWRGPLQCGSALLLLPITAAHQYERFSHAPPAEAGPAERYLAARAKRNLGWAPCPADKCAAARTCDGGDPGACVQLADQLWEESRLDLAAHRRVRDADRLEAIRLLAEGCGDGYAPSCRLFESFRSGPRRIADSRDPALRTALDAWACDLPGDPVEACMQAAAAAERSGQPEIRERALGRACRLGRASACDALAQRAARLTRPGAPPPRNATRLPLYVALRSNPRIAEACTQLCDARCAADLAACRDAGDAARCFAASACACACNLDLGSCGLPTDSLERCVEQYSPRTQSLASDDAL